MGEITANLYGPARYVDAHMHFWEDRADWYEMPSGKVMGATNGRELPAKHDLSDYLAAAGTGVVKVVHVSALVHRPFYAIDETLWLDTIAASQGFPHAVVGTLNTAVGLKEIESQLDVQMTSSVFRGVRLLGGIDYESALGKGVMRALETRSLVYDVVAHPGTIGSATKAAGCFPKLPFIMEHTGWPLSTDNEQFLLWRKEISEFAAMPNSYCKLSGLAMTYHRFDSVEFRKYYDCCLEVFSPSRCMFGSNFPVDGLYGPFLDLFSTFVDVCTHLSAEEQSRVFGETADKVYRI